MQVIFSILPNQPAASNASKCEVLRFMRSQISLKLAAAVVNLGKTRQDGSAVIAKRFLNFAAHGLFSAVRR